MNNSVHKTKFHGRDRKISKTIDIIYTQHFFVDNWHPETGKRPTIPATDQILIKARRGEATTVPKSVPELVKLQSAVA